MKKLIFLFAVSLIVIMAIPTESFAQGVPSPKNKDSNYRKKVKVTQVSPSQAPNRKHASASIDLSQVPTRKIKAQPVDNSKPYLVAPQNRKRSAQKATKPIRTQKDQKVSRMRN